MMNKAIFIFLLSLISYQAGAQLCQGSLGDPIVNITFGAGSNPGMPLAAAATGYQFSAADCPGDGAYTVRSNTNSCFGSTWHALSADHTGNAGGYFMLVNASIQPAAFYVDTVKGLCGNSTYEFAAWVVNMLLPSACSGSGIKPNLTFSIERTDGTVLKTYNSGDIPSQGSPLWQQYGFFFTTPPTGADIVLRIVNNAPGGCGNDLALDDITFRPCGPQLTPSVTGQQGTNINICFGEAKTWQFNCTVSGGFTNPVFQWQSSFNGGAWNDLSPSASPLISVSVAAGVPVGNVRYRLSVAEAGNLGSPQCRINSNPITININPNPVAIAVNNGPACIGSSVTLTATGGDQYAWTGPGGFTSNMGTSVLQNIQPAQAGVYRVIATSDLGCVSPPATTTLVVNPVPTAAVPFINTSICTKDSVQLSSSGGAAYTWSPVAGLSATSISSPKASPAADTRYMVVVANAAGCTDTAYIDVKVFVRAIAHAGPDKFLVEGQTVILAGSIEGSYQSFSWSPSTYLTASETLTPASRPPADISYVLTVQSNNGCGITKDTMDVKFYKGIYIPSAFTPNGDAINPTWNIPALNAFPGFELHVFNRYGQVVFETKNANVAWNGKFKGEDVPAGAYIYVIDLKKDPGILKGTVMVIR